MEQQLNLKHKIGQGILPQQFMDGMQVREIKNSGIPNTKEKFGTTYEHFSWKHEDDRQFFTAFHKNSLQCLILCTDWCPDVIWNVPVLFRVVEQSQIATEILIMEDHLETMDLFLTDGVRNQPIAIFLDKDGNVLGRWGARPAYIQDVMNQFKAENTDKQAPDYRDKLNQIYTDIGNIYNAGTEYQEVMIEELKRLFSTFVS